MNNIKFYDIETGPNEERTKLWMNRLDPIPPETPPGPFDPNAVALGNAKKPETVAKKLQEEEAKHNEMVEDYPAVYAASVLDHIAKHMDKAALSPRTAEILTIQIGDNDEEGVKMIVGDERDILEEFWDMFRNGDTFVNWTGGGNSANWDLNMIYRRSLAHGLFIPAEGHPTASGRATTRFIDLTPRFLSFEMHPAYMKLEDACFEFDITIPDCAPVTGATFWKFWRGLAKEADGAAGWSKADQRNAAERYAMADITALRSLYNLVDGF